MSTTTPALTAQQIGSSFVSKYYNTLTKESEQLFKFYKDNSTLIYGNETTEKNAGVVTGLEAIGSKIKSLNYNECKVKLSVVDSLNSLNGSVLVVVHGHLSFAGAPYKKFSQSFVLAEQVSPKGYYVLNDVFRFVTSEDIPAPSKKTKPVASSSPTPQSQPAATSQKSVTIAAHSPSNDNLSESGSSEVDSTAATAGTTTSSVVGPEDSMMSDSETTETSQAKQKNAKPTTPPSVSSKPQEQPAAEQPKKPATAPSPSTQQPQPTQAQPQPQSAPAKSQHDKKKFEPKTYAAAVGGTEYIAPQTPSSPAPKEEGEKQQKPQRPPFKRGIPLHVSKVKPETTGKDLSEAFLKFGPIVHISNKSKENFAVIFFENAASVDQAVASNGSITVAGVTVEVEKREKFNRNRANGGERPLRGRGGFRGKGERGSKFGRGRGRGQAQAPAQAPAKPTTA